MGRRVTLFLSFSLFSTSGIEKKKVTRIIVNLGPEIEGESTLPDYEGKVEAIAYSHEIKRPLDVQMGYHGVSYHGDVVVTRLEDKATPKICEKCSKGESLPHVQIITFRSAKSGGIEKDLVLDLQNVRITRVTSETKVLHHPQTHEMMEHRVLEHVALNYDAIQWKYNGFLASYDITTSGKEEYIPPIV